MPQTLIQIPLDLIHQEAHHTTAVVSVHELFTSPEPESIDASNTQEQTTDRE